MAVRYVAIFPCSGDMILYSSFQSLHDAAVAGCDGDAKQAHGVILLKAAKHEIAEIEPPGLQYEDGSVIQLDAIPDDVMHCKIRSVLIAAIPAVL